MAEGIGKEHERENVTIGERIGDYVVGALLCFGRAASYIVPVSEEEMSEYRKNILEEDI